MGTGLKRKIAQILMGQRIQPTEVPPTGGTSVEKVEKTLLRMAIRELEGLVFSISRGLALGHLD
jgi:hypothetical protein